MTKLSLMKYPGGSFHTSPWIISLFPKNYTELDYIEPFAGAANTLFQKKPSKTESITDLDFELINVYHCIKYRFNEFYNLVKDIKYSEDTWNRWKKYQPRKMVATAVKKYIHHNFSRGGLGKDFAWSERLRGGRPGDENAWINKVNNLPKIHARLQNVFISSFGYHIFFLDDLPNLHNQLILLDPPFLHETRVTKKMYKYEFTVEQHKKLLDDCINSKSKIVLLGYDSELYNSKLKNWNRHEKSMASSMGQTKKKSRKTQIVWTNY